MTHNLTRSKLLWFCFLIAWLVSAPSALASPIPDLGLRPVAVIPGIAVQVVPPSAVGTSKLVFDVPGPALADVQAYLYKHYDDGAATGTLFAPGTVTCATSATANLFTCTVPFPAYTPGNHAVTLTASNSAGEGPPSASFSFKFEVTPGKIVNVRIGGE